MMFELPAGFIAWSGSEDGMPPANLYGSLVEVITKAGHRQTVRSYDLYWKKMEMPSDIIAYRPIDPQKPDAIIIQANKNGVKHDQHKPRFDLIPPHAERQVAEVLEYGARKYAPDNWRKVDDARARYLAAARRHINASQTGESIDPESGLNHLAHAITSLMFILELELCNSSQHA
jgi:hypothetical protein